MQSASPKKSQSPLKTALSGTLAKKVIAYRFTDSMLEQKQAAELQLLCKEKDIEAEHKLNTLIALSEKLEVFNDLKKDLSENQRFVQDSENARTKLQRQITITAEQIKEDTNTKQKY